MLLFRTRQKFVHALKGFIFDVGRFQQMLDLRNKRLLEDSMGFRGQLDEHRRFQMAFLKGRGLISSHRLLEIGCGPLTAGIPIIEYLERGNYVEVDVRRTVLDMAWAEVGKAGLSAKNPRLICSSSFGSEELGEQKFDFILSFCVLYHLYNDILKSYFAVIRRRLKPTGICLANVNVLDESSTWLEFPFLKRTVDEYRQAAASNELETSCLGELKDL